ncbi:transmembrane emp24 domain-containing protein 1-like [Babylonia areolata]|uniref:transmembrane emp24 domain-containing protein 1-like n=1 Tax=Babylonia areolata TaxID=304850 RepID=UPI003FD2A426
MEADRLVGVTLLLSLLVFQVGSAIEVDLTVEINAGSTDCFWQKIKSQVSAELEYQVIDGGDLDIDCAVYAPDGRVLQMESRKTENVIRFETDVEGEYKICFDNSFSRMSTKVVFFELIAEHDDDSDDDDDDDWNIDMEEVKDMVDFTVEDLKGIIDRAKENLDKSIQLQNLIKMHEARDRNVAEANFSRVNNFSAFQLFIMITVGLTQVLMIRSLFQEKKAAHQGLKQQT